MNDLTRQKRVLLAMGQHYIDRIHHGAVQYASENRWHLTNLFGNDPQLIDQHNCDGIIAVLDHHDPLSEVILQKKCPIVNLSILRKELNISHITGNNNVMGRDAARHFIERGFKNFMWFSEHRNAPAVQRMEGYRDELKAHGLDCSQLVIKDRFPDGIPPWEPLQNWILQAIHVLPHPCAIYAYNDALAVHLIDACNAGGIRIPDEVAILGTNNHPCICPVTMPPLSSINHNLEEIGRRAAEELDHIMNGRPVHHQIIEIPHQGITVRQSSDVFAINDRQIVLALRYIHANFHRSISIRDIVAAASPTSRRTLETRFMTLTNKTILETLNKLRLQKSCELLQQTDLSIADVAAASGFRTPEYFHRFFLKQTKTTPRRYREAHP